MPLGHVPDVSSTLERPATTCAGSTVSYQVASETVHTQSGRDTVNDTSDTLNQHRDAPVILKATALNAANASWLRQRSQHHLAPLTTDCPDCVGGWRWISRYVTGCSPDGDEVPCLTCDGTASIEVPCDGCHDDTSAVERFAGLAWCQVCGAEQRADAAIVGEVG